MQGIRPLHSVPSVRRMWLMPVVIGLLVGLSLTIAAEYLLQQQVDNDLQLKLKLRTEVIESDIISRMQTYHNVLIQTRGLMALEPELDQQRLVDYIKQIDLMGRYPGLRSMGFAARVPAAKVQEHEVAMRQRGWPDYRVMPLSNDAEEAYPVVLLAPTDKSSNGIFGFNMFSERVRREGIAAAAATGKVQLSGLVKLKAGLDLAPASGSMLYLPVYRQDQQVTTIAQRQNAVVGILYSAFRSSDLFEGIFGASSSLDHEVSFSVYDGDTTAPEALIYDREQTLKIPPRQALGAPLRRVMTIAGHPWTLTVTPLPGLSQGLAARLPLLVLAAGLFMTVLLCKVLYEYASQAARDRRARQQAEVEMARAKAIAECGSVLNSSIKGDSKVQRVADLIVAEMASACIVTRTSGARSGDLPTATVATAKRRGAPPAGETLAKILAAHGNDDAVQPTLVVKADQTLRVEGIGSYIIQPLMAMGQHHGSLLLLREPNDAAFDHGDLLYAEAVAGRIAMVLDNEKAYLELRAAKDKAEALMRAKTKLISTISPKLRAPLGAVLGFADMLREPLLESAERKAFTATILRNAQELDRLMDDLMRIADADHEHKKPPRVS